MLNIVFTCSSNRMCNSYWCSTCVCIALAPVSECFFSFTRIFTRIMLAHKQCNAMWIRQKIIVTAVAACAYTTYRSLPFLSSLLEILILIVCHKVESETPNAFFPSLFTLPNSYTVIYHLHWKSFTKISKFMHELLSVCLLVLSLSLSQYTNVMNCVHHIIQNQFNSIEFNSHLSLNSSFCFPWQWTETIATTAAAAAVSFHFVCCHRMRANTQHSYKQIVFVVYALPIASFIRLLHCKMNLKICQTATGTVGTQNSKICATLWQAHRAVTHFSCVDIIPLKSFFSMLCMLYAIFCSEIELWLNAINLNEKIPIKQTRWVDVIAFKTLAYQADMAAIAAAAAAASAKVFCKTQSSR